MIHQFPSTLFLLFTISSIISTCVCLSEVDILKDISVISTRTADLTSQIVKIKTDYQIKNKGKSDISFFVHAISENEAKHLSWMTSVETGKDSARLRISKISVKGSPQGFVFHKIELLNLLAPGASMSITVEHSLTEYLVPYPKEIVQAENQLVLYRGFANVISAYHVESESTTFKVGKTKPISFTDINPVKHVSGQIVYGPYQNTPAYSKKDIEIHYENNAPFLVATSVERIIEVSHWGNLAVEEHIEVVHKGAFLKGPFSRLDFQLDRRGSSQPVVKSFKTNLPIEARDIYYRDEIGNISTSSLYSRNNRLEVELRPRFPLFGGWRTNYVLGYNLPTADYLFSSKSNYALKFRLFGHLFDNAVVEKLKVKIILPEMSKNIKLVTPYSVKRLPDETHKTYLDTFGRPVIVLEKENLVNSHIQTFTLYYEFERVNLLREPLILIAAFATLFLGAILLSLLDFSIAGKDSHKDKDTAHLKKE